MIATVMFPTLTDRQRAAAALVLALTMSACRCQPKLESAVDAPVTMAQAKAKASPPDVVVTVERVTRPSSGVGCAHSPLCVIFLPVILWNEMFPEKYDEVVIVDHGKETYRGSFAVNGDFLQARVNGDGDVKDLRQLRLTELGKRIVVVVARGADADHMAPVPVVPQIDLVTEYKSAIEAAAGKSDKRAAALDVEAITWLDKEALPLVKGRMGDAATPDAEKAGVLAAVCRAGGGVKVEEDASAAALVAAAAASGPGPRASMAALVPCANITPLADRIGFPAAQPFVDGAVDAMCKRSVDVRASEWRDVVGRGSATVTAALRGAAAARCNDPAARAFFALSFGDPVDDAALAAALKTAWGADLLADPHALAHTPLIAAALDDDDLAPDALDSLFRVGATVRTDEAPPEALVVPLARRYAKGVHALFCTGYEREAGIIHWLARAPVSSRADIVKALRAARTDKRGGIVDAGLVVFGADVDPKPIKKEIGSSIRKKDAPACDDAGVIRAALDDAGCTAVDLDKPRLRCAGASSAHP